uniref:LITAF domain-containing protein n=1 Tax=Lotharella oceanica TaxID=641309 RepID=A0A7S2TJN4_9EUKA|eukprot:CAMPEP_0170199054 /NCGR_PEP_ID=MMETSP0040_2-20121228/69125_1 /TAXON_ID=641309 /ORGANISM="Lotharella oceanica, Strain CCMP622" /LENGTH=136 /DNA_ID=CAMNT_0010449135 /DNA_START=355 /DNA_END=765 /DNA_ORIENTATION=-
MSNQQYNAIPTAPAYTDEPQVVLAHAEPVAQPIAVVTAEPVVVGQQPQPQQGHQQQGQVPNCVRCGRPFYPMEEKETSILQWGCCCLLVFVFWPCACVPFCIPDCYDTAVKCRSCGYKGPQVQPTRQGAPGGPPVQ